MRPSCNGCKRWVMLWCSHCLRTIYSRFGRFPLRRVARHRPSVVRIFRITSRLFASSLLSCSKLSDFYLALTNTVFSPLGLLMTVSEVHRNVATISQTNINHPGARNIMKCRTKTHTHISHLFSLIFCSAIPEVFEIFFTLLAVHKSNV